MHQTTYDCIVLGVGGVGSAVLFEMARRGAKVLGIDRFVPGHDRGSSHGETRLIRLAYFEHPHYVPLLQRAYHRWHELEERSGRSLYTATGLLQVGPEQGELIQGVLASATAHHLDVTKVDAAAARQQFPGFVIPPDLSILFDRQAGFLRVEDCIRTHVAEAQKLGAELKTGETVRHWEASPASIAVTTTQGRYQAAALVIAGGAWAPALLAELALPFEIRRKALFWYANTDARYTVSDACPAFLFELAERIFYGFPALDDLGVKVGEHTGGRVVTDPLHVDRTLDAKEANHIEAFLAAHLPGVTKTRLHHSVCMYTQTPDAHFVVGQHPLHPHVSIVAGLSGHGFKFAGVLGEALADLALNGSTPLPIDFLSPSRFVGAGKPVHR